MNILVEKNRQALKETLQQQSEGNSNMVLYHILICKSKIAVSHKCCDFRRNVYLIVKYVLFNFPQQIIQNQYNSSMDFDGIITLSEPKLKTAVIISNK